MTKAPSATTDLSDLLARVEGASKQLRKCADRKAAVLTVQYGDAARGSTVEDVQSEAMADLAAATLALLRALIAQSDKPQHGEQS